jgi:hypothetical protein
MTEREKREKGHAKTLSMNEENMAKAKEPRPGKQSARRLGPGSPQERGGEGEKKKGS